MAVPGVANARLAGVALLVATFVVSIRVLGSLEAAGGPAVNVPAMSDFRDAVYDPIAAFLNGENPYDRPTFVQKYPGSFGIGLYSPLTLALHLPFGLAPLRVATVVYYFVSLLLTVALAPLVFRLAGIRTTPARVLAFAAVMVASRPGHWNLFAGQVTLQATLATYLALWWARTRPQAAGVMLAMATFKPTYGLPLGALMAARGDRRAVAWGVAVAAVLTGAVAAVLIANVGVGALVDSILATYRERAANPAKSAAVAPFRVDVVALTGRLLGDAPGYVTTFALMLGVLAFAAVALRRIADRPGRAAAAHAVAIGTLAILACTYHQQYDLVGLALPLAALVWPADDGPWAGWPRLRVLALAVVALPLANYLSSDTARRWIGFGPDTLLAVSSVNGVAILVLLGMFGAIAIVGKRQEGAMR